MARDKINKFAELDEDLPQGKMVFLPEGFHIQKDRTEGEAEKLSERLNIIVKPTTKKKLIEYSKESGQSMNTIINSLIESHLKKKGKL